MKNTARPAIYGLLATVGLIVGSVIIAALAVNGLQLVFGF